MIGSYRSSSSRWRILRRRRALHFDFGSLRREAPISFSCVSIYKSLRRFYLGVANLFLWEALCDDDCDNVEVMFCVDARRLLGIRKLKARSLNRVNPEAVPDARSGFSCSRG